MVKSPKQQRVRKREEEEHAQCGVGGEGFDRRIAARAKGKISKMIVRPVMAYGLDDGSDQEAELEVAKLKMLRF